MTELKVPGGTSVHRAWGDGGTEFLAWLQYEGDAKEYAERKLSEDAQRGWFESFYVLSNHYNGSLEIARHKIAEKAVAA